MWALIGTIASGPHSHPVVAPIGSGPATCASGAAEVLAIGMTRLRRCSPVRMGWILSAGRGSALPLLSCGPTAYRNGLQGRPNESRPVGTSGHGLLHGLGGVWVAAVLVALLVGCGSPSGTTAVDRHTRPATPAAPSPSSSPSPFSGSGYTYSPPVGWFAKAGTGMWERGVSPVPGAIGFDRFTSREGDLWMMIGRRPIARGVSLQEWVDDMTASHTITYGIVTCVPPEHSVAGTLDGESAIFRSFHCPVDGPKGMAVHVLALHRQHGYLAMCGSPQGTGGTLRGLETMCGRLLAGFRFNP